MRPQPGHDWEWAAARRRRYTTALLLLVAVLAIVFGGGLARGDDSPVEKPKPKPRGRRPAAAKVAPAPAAMPAPTPQCSPATPLRCDCWYGVVAPHGNPLVWEWLDCPPVEPPAERLAFDELVVPEEPPEAPPAPPPALEEIEPEEPGLRVAVQAWSLVGFSGAADERITYGGRLGADGPVAWRGAHALRMFAELDLTAQPGQVADFSSVEAFGRSAEFRGGTYLRLWERRPAGQHITTSAVAWAGFATVLEAELIRDHYRRSFGVGVRLAEEVGGASLVVGYCRDEAAGYIGVGQVCVTGNVPIAGTRGTMVVGGTAVLNMSRATVTQQRDRFVLYLGASLGDIVEAVREARGR